MITLDQFNLIGDVALAISRTIDTDDKEKVRNRIISAYESQFMEGTDKVNPAAAFMDNSLVCQLVGVTGCDWESAEMFIGAATIASLSPWPSSEITYSIAERAFMWHQGRLHGLSEQRLTSTDEPA